MVEGIDSTTMLNFSDQLLADLEGMEKRCPQARGRQPWGRQAQSSSCLSISGRAVLEFYCLRVDPGPLHLARKVALLSESV